MSASLHTDIEMEIIPDADPDVSWLEQEGFEDRLTAYRNGDFGLVGVRAAVEIIANGTIQTISSPGLWGIEDDSGDAYFAEVFAEERADLLSILEDLGVDLSTV